MIEFFYVLEWKWKAAKNQIVEKTLEHFQSYLQSRYNNLDNSTICANIMKIKFKLVRMLNMNTKWAE